MISVNKLNKINYIFVYWIKQHGTTVRVSAKSERGFLACIHNVSKMNQLKQMTIWHEKKQKVIQTDQCHKAKLFTKYDEK